MEYFPPLYTMHYNGLLTVLMGFDICDETVWTILYKEKTTMKHDANSDQPFVVVVIVSQFFTIYIYCSMFIYVKISVYEGCANISNITHRNDHSHIAVFPSKRTRKECENDHKMQNQNVLAVKDGEKRTQWTC